MSLARRTSPNAPQVAAERARPKPEAPQSEELPPLDPYNNSLIMPLAEFIQHPDVHDLLHNGAAYQVSKLPSGTYSSSTLQ